MCAFRRHVPGHLSTHTTRFHLHYHLPIHDFQEPKLILRWPSRMPHALGLEWHCCFIPGPILTVAVLQEYAEICARHGVELRQSRNAATAIREMLTFVFENNGPQRSAS